MIARISPRPLGGTVRAIPSKSVLHRQLIFAALSDRSATVDTGRGDAPISDDVLATADCLRALGAEIRFSDGVFSVTPVTRPPERAELRCGESGSTLRFLLPVAAALGVNADFIMDGRLPERPLDPLAVSTCIWLTDLTLYKLHNPLSVCFHHIFRTVSDNNIISALKK
ncbi:MAG: hypothetical protein II736_02025, partial [Clostridia bacterium]|nr:hypothetical protein [Clostridia bacterium]